MTTSGSSNNRPFDRPPEKAALEREIKACRRAVLVVNTRSRRGERSYSDAKRRLIEAGFMLDAAYPVRSAERLPDVVRGAIAQERKFIIIGGGDGTALMSSLGYCRSARPTASHVSWESPFRSKARSK